MAGSSIQVSIIVPAYHEAANIPSLTERLFKALGPSEQKSTELIIVDDNSMDGSEENVKKLISKGYPIRIIVRKTERGLSSAVLRGFLEAKGDVLICMDADLQHPPESVPDMIKSIRDQDKSKIEFAIGTRYPSDSSVRIDENWAWYRKFISNGARMLSRPLSPLSDPMTGFFAIRKDIFRQHLASINPVGFKIALELFVKCNIKNHAEIPIQFGIRTAGSSKLTGKVMFHYLKHLRDLYYFRYPFTKFAFPIGILFLFWIFSWVSMKLLLLYYR